MDLDPEISSIFVHHSSEQSSYQPCFMSGLSKEHAYESFQLVYLINSTVKDNKRLVQSMLIFFLSECHCCHTSLVEATSKDKLILEGNSNNYIDMKTGDLYWKDAILYFAIKHFNISFLTFSKQHVDILT